ncbi:hypothetical protein U9M48_044055 [Paspalum notatum var. saurae]|uniref:Uncharacterized protein n=1 Tax=Paspalum notatum var. saurae TaxID=547442 RepID=A0AAQ3XG86_PASNO
MARSSAPPGVALCPITNRTTTPLSFSSRRSLSPRGTHVSRSESRRLLLLKAVLMPTTTNAFGRTPLDGAATPSPPFCFARSTASSISSDDTDLSSDLPVVCEKRDPGAAA